MPGRRQGWVDDPAHALGDEPALAEAAVGQPTFGSEYRRRRAAASVRSRWGAFMAAALVAGPFAILGAFLAGSGSPSLLIVVVVIAPIAEEMLKAAGSLFLAEQRPWLVPAAWTLVAVTVVAGLVFAAIENAVYLWVYIDDPTTEVIRWRWVFGPLVHGTGSLLAGIGVARMWTEVDRHAAAPRFTVAVPWLVAAMAVHGLYNGAVTIWELAGGGI